MSKLSHLTDKGEAHMVDISHKAETTRVARAESIVQFSTEAMDLLLGETNPKGDVFATARIAGIQAAKKCSDLIPLCHPLPLSKVEVELETDLERSRIRVVTTCKTQGMTGVEMEALTAASIAALTIYDMCKAIDKGIEILQTRLLMKSGGKSGEWQVSD